MDIMELQHEIELLPRGEQDRLAAFLLALRLRREGTIEEIRQRLDDKNSDNWISWKKAKAELGLNEPGK